MRPITNVYAALSVGLMLSADSETNVTRKKTEGVVEGVGAEGERRERPPTIVQTVRHSGWEGGAGKMNGR
ncbi:hypothetical protein BaRGS_00011853 [Batillaria attramentaria]|uniref:Secreted protein n=1 Tax=Batillaria attramentaria TaxID=370345 RepID=A0ABD0LC56_9CAEN